MFYPKGSDTFTAKLELQPSDYQSLSRPFHLTPRILQLATLVLADQHPKLDNLGVRVVLPPEVHGQHIPALKCSSTFPDAHDDWKYLVIPTRTLEGTQQPRRWNIIFLDRAARAVILLETDWKECRTISNERMIRELLLEKEGGQQMDVRFSLGTWSYRLLPDPHQSMHELNNQSEREEESGAVVSAVMQRFARNFVEQGKAVYPESWQCIFGMYKGERERLRSMCDKLNPATDSPSQEDAQEAPPTKAVAQDRMPMRTAAKRGGFALVIIIIIIIIIIITTPEVERDLVDMSSRK